MHSFIHCLLWKHWNDSKVYLEFSLPVYSAVLWGKLPLFVDGFCDGFFCSTLSSGLNSLAAVVHSDIIKFFYRKPMTDKQDLWYSKMLCKTSIWNSPREIWISYSHSTRVWRCLHLDNISCFPAWKSSSSNPITLRCSIGSHQCNIHDRVFSSLD